jgi:hypothetical protein
MKDMVTAFHQVTVYNISRFFSGIDPLTNKPRVFAGNADKVTQLHLTGHAMGIITFESGKLVAIFHDNRMLSGHKGASLMKDLYGGSVIGTLGLTREQLGQQFTGFASDGHYIELNCPGHLAVQQPRSVTGRELPINSPKVKAMRDWLLTTWDKAHQIELFTNDAMVNWPRGSGPSARNSLSSILWYKDIAKIISDIVARFGYGEAYEALKEMAENNGVKFYELQRLCDTIFAQSERKVYVSLLEFGSYGYT